MNKLFAKVSQAKKRVAAAVMSVMALAVAAVPVGAAPLDFSTTTVDIDVKDVVGSGVSFMGIFKDYMLLGLGIIVATIIIGIVFWVIQKGRKAAPGK